MDGARLILNARYFHIAQTGEKATKYAFVAEAAAGLVNYIATRESVIYNYDEHYKEVSATEAQREAINQFLEVSPDLELSREFKAYDEDRSAANASALISRAAQYTCSARTHTRVCKQSAGHPSNTGIQRLQGLPYA